MIRYLAFVALSLHLFSIQNVSTEKVLILAPVKNIEKGFYRSKKNIDQFASNFLDFRIIIYENNSIDETKNLFNLWKNLEPRLIFISEDLDLTYQKNFTRNIGDYRTEFIARARNILLKEAFKKEYDDYKYLLMADLDLFLDWQIDEMIDSLSNPKKEWDAILPASTYDLYALRNDNFKLNPELISPTTWFALKKRIGLRYAKYLKQPDWIKIDSAFGGLALFKRSSLSDIRYHGLITPDYLDYILDQDLSKDSLYQRYSAVLNDEIILRKNQLIRWKESGFNQTLIPDNGYVCEHAQFFFEMKKRGRDKIYINPKWKHFSLEHKNW